MTRGAQGTNVAFAPNNVEGLLNQSHLTRIWHNMEAMNGS